MSDVPATEFKAKCLELMDRVAEQHETFVITKRGKPVARLVPVERKPDEPLFGGLEDMVEEVSDIVAPALPEGAWETLREWDTLNPPGSARKKTRRPGRRAAPRPR
jgi:prevent-host-death family protein